MQIVKTKIRIEFEHEFEFGVDDCMKQDIINNICSDIINTFSEQHSISRQHIKIESQSITKGEKK